MGESRTRLISTGIFMILFAGCSSMKTTPVTGSLDPVKVPNASMSYYEFSGTTKVEMRAQMKSSRPAILNKDRGYDSWTHWQSHWTWPGYGRDACDLSKAKVTLDVEVIFPRWTASDRASPQLVTNWIHYTEALALHESGHVRLATESEQSIRAAIQNATCLTANEAAKSALAQLKEKNIEYDRVTDHGRTQGAKF
jgi:predicted secreted Zn-dependent protease